MKEVKAGFMGPSSVQLTED